MNNEHDHVEPSNGDSLSSESDAAGSSPGDVQSELDPVRAKLEAMFDLLRRPAETASPPSENRIDETSQARQRFRLIRPHAKGGLGEVWVALDEELNRDVAFKEIQTRYAGHAESRSRFLREATVTGQLEHPGIVPVYAVGEQGDGRPFYAMRLIQGDSLQKAIDRFHKTHGPRTDLQQRQLELRKLLDRFIDVCNAIAYAHSRGVIHRDLKPDNIMLGGFGETLVVDWGLAKSVSGNNENDVTEGRPAASADMPAPTQLGATIGTPAYMSPEQAAGRTDQLGPLSDVYSLGATLYCILTGQPPFTDSNLETVLAKVQRGEFTRPRQIASAVPPALEAVCLKAMALAPGNRYGSPQALADDLEHWLADEAVSALPDPVVTRLYRWSRRNKPVVTGISALIATGILALGVSNVLLKKEQERTESRRLEAVAAEGRATANEKVAIANQQLAEKSQADAVANLKLAESNEQRARRNGEAAEKNRELADKRATEAAERFAVAIDSLTLLISGVQEELENRAVATEFRRNLLQVAQKSLERLMVDTNRTKDSDRVLLACHLKMGDIQTALGNLELARIEFKSAEAIAVQAIRDDPSDTVMERNLVGCLEKLAQHARLGSRLREALELDGQTLAIRRKRLAANPKDLDAQRELGLSYLELGRTHLALGDFESSREHFTKGVDIHKAIAAERPFLWSAQRDVILAHQGFANLERQVKHADEAKTHVVAAATIAADLLARDPTNKTVRRDLFAAFQLHGFICLDVGDFPQALQLFKRGYDIARELADADPDNAIAQWDFATTNDNLAEVNSKSGNFSSAVEYYTSEVAILERLGDRGLNPEQRRRFLAQTSDKLGVAKQTLGDVPGARLCYESALKTLGALSPEEIGGRDVRRLRATIFGNRGFCERYANEFPAAVEFFQIALNECVALQSTVEDPGLRSLVEIYQTQLAFCETAVQAIESLDFALRQPAESVPILVGTRAMVLVRRGEYVAAAEAVEKLAAFGGTNPAHWYDAACGFALCAGALAKNVAHNEPTDDDKAVQIRYVTRAMDLLTQAEAAGFLKKREVAANLKQNPQLNPLRALPAFQELIARVSEATP